jgi:hypothetical protein
MTRLEEFLKRNNRLTDVSESLDASAGMANHGADAAFVLPF